MRLGRLLVPRRRVNCTGESAPTPIVDRGGRLPVARREKAAELQEGQRGEVRQEDPVAAGGSIEIDLLTRDLHQMELARSPMENQPVAGTELEGAGALPPTEQPHGPLLSVGCWDATSR